MFDAQSNNMARWYALVEQAKSHCGYQLDNGLDHYLVLTLDAFIQDNAMASSILALDFLENIDANSGSKVQSLRHVGDQCLLLSGLFPERAQKRNVSLGYYVDLGKHAYYQLSSASPHLKLNNELFYLLSQHFVGLMDILHQLRLTPSVSYGDSRH